MAYRVFIVEPIDVDNWIELDTESVDMSTIFSVADIQDISKRNDNITKQIAFKGSQVNNEAFGNLFHMNRVADFDLDNRLFFNYNPLRTVDCFIYEDSVMVFKGSLRVLEVNSDKAGNVVYQTLVNGSFIDFRLIVSEKMLEDLDFSDLKHRYKWSNMEESWDQRTERFNVTGNTYIFKPFQKGSGYVYPFIDHGVWYKKLGEPLDIAKVNIENFRPAVYVREYFDRIFKQPELTGFTYELKGSQNLVDRFNSLVIPNNVEKIINKSNNMMVKAFTTSNQSQSWNLTAYGGSEGQMYGSRAVQFSSLQNAANILNWYGQIKGQNGCSFMIQRTFTSDAYCKLKINSFYNNHNSPLKVSVQLCEREFKSETDGSFSDANSWNVVATKSINVGSKQGINNVTLELEVGEREWKMNNQLLLRLTYQGNNVITEVILGVNVSYTFSDGVIRFPKDDNGLLTYEVKDGDAITPVPPSGVKQLDFIKSVIQMFNLYVYTEKERPKHLIFQTYSDYYGLTQPHMLVSTALDWTDKVDYTSGFKIASNVKLPKNYLFTWKEDGDTINSNYKKNYGEVYGTFRFNDAYGLTSEKKVELIFSPSPLVTYLGSGRVHPAIYSVDGANNGNKKPSKSNIRIMYYNGVKECQPYTVGKDAIVSNIQDIAVIKANLVKYAQVGNYFLKPGLSDMTPLDDMYWGLAKEFYFTSLPAHQSCPTAYHNYYINQVSDLTNPNVTYVDCDVYLNEVDIANLNLRTPVFIDMGEFGHSYWKVLEVEYENNNTTSKVKLQRIVI